MPNPSSQGSTSAPSSSQRGERTALVLAGGAARGAYEVGVVQYVAVEVAREIGREIPFDILCGTSVGALNACGLAAFAHLGRERVHKLVDVWGALDIMQLVQPDLRALFDFSSRFMGRSPKPDPDAPGKGGLIDPTGLEQLVEREIPFALIDENIRRGHLSALTVSTTHVASGKTVVYVHAESPELPRWGNDPTTIARATKITARHALASAAIPILFRAIELDGAFYCDGGLRQNVPLSPARRLGASRVLVVNPRYIDLPRRADETPLPTLLETTPGPFLVLGKALNALMLDRIDTDLARLESINQILAAGTRAFGPGFTDALNKELGKDTKHGLAPMQACLVRATEDIGKMAADFVRRPAFDRVRGMTGRLLRRLADPESRRDSDLLSYLLFDGQFAKELIELGRNDARRRHDELCRFFSASAS